MIERHHLKNVIFIQTTLNYSWKRALCIYKRGPFCLTKGHLDNLKGQVEVKSLLIRSCFWHFQFKLRTKILFSKWLFPNKAPHTRMFYLPEIGPDIRCRGRSNKSKLDTNSKDIIMLVIWSHCLIKGQQVANYFIKQCALCQRLEIKLFKRVG